MNEAGAFDVELIERAGWRQGSVLPPDMLTLAGKHAPPGLARALTSADWLIVTSHDCDVVNPKLVNEPEVEILRAVVAQGAPDKQMLNGRSPRTLCFTSVAGEVPVVLRASVHERWTVPRELLLAGAPAQTLGTKERRLVAEWLAKRYIRSAFPSSFDARWRSKLSEWTKLLARRAGDIQGVYLRLSTHDELGQGGVYSVSLLVVAPAIARENPSWPDTRRELGTAIEAFWSTFEPGIVVEEADVRATDEVFLADLDGYQRFDADWVSFADDTETVPAVLDLRM